jgi:hypothetical protein
MLSRRNACFFSVITAQDYQHLHYLPSAFIAVAPDLHSFLKQS